MQMLVLGTDNTGVGFLVDEWLTAVTYAYSL